MGDRQLLYFSYLINNIGVTLAAVLVSKTGKGTVRHACVHSYVDTRETRQRDDVSEALSR